MRKALSLILALMLVLSLSVTAFAAPAAPAAQNAAEETHFSFDKVWKNAEGQQVPDNLVPQETLRFDVANTLSPMTENTTPRLEIFDVAAATGKQTIDITVPVYTVLGVYKYTITEKAGNTQGVVYCTEPIEVEVLVTNAAEGEGLEKTIYFTKKIGDTEVKLDNIENTYNYSTPNGKYKDLTVDKVVTGNLGDKNQKFSINVTFNAGKPVLTPITYNGNETIKPEAWKNGSVTVAIETSDKDGAVSFTNIPEGVTYEVKEHPQHTVADETKNNPKTGYTVTYTGENGTISEKASNAVVTNNKGTEVNTGVALDSVPYIIMITVAVLGVVLFTVKARKAED